MSCFALGVIWPRFKISADRAVHIDSEMTLTLFASGKKRLGRTLMIKLMSFRTRHFATFHNQRKIHIFFGVS